MIEWVEYRLDDLSNVLMGLSPSGDTYNEIGNGMPLLNGPTEFGETYPNCTVFTTDPKRICKKGDLIFCVRGSTTGRMNWADKEYALGRGVCSITGKDELTTIFIKHLLTLNLKSLLQITGGGTFPNLRKEDINGFKFKAPGNYREIAKILSSFDDLIEKNLKRIKLLEEAIQIVYETISNQKNVQDKLIYPEFCDFIKGSEPGSENYSSIKFDNSTPFLRVGDLGSRNSEIFIDKSINTLKFTNKDDILVSLDGTIGIVRIGMVGAYSSGIRKVFCKNPLLKGFIYAFLKSKNGQNQIMTYAKGSTILHASSAIPKLKFRFTENSETKLLFEKINSMLILIVNLLEQNDKLKESRDILLPRLMSGTIKIESI